MTTPPMGAPWGASADDWLHFANTLGLEPDLLPVVSNPGAKISEKSKLRDLGKTPSRYDKLRHVVGIPSWTSHVASDRDVGRWLRDSDYGICLQTRATRAIDIDIADLTAARRVLDLVGLGAGVLPRRMRQGTGKCLLAFHMPGDFAKRVIRTAEGVVEFLATGQQFVAVGTHPTGTRYEWVDGDGVLGLPAAIPELTPAEFEVMWQALVETFALPDGESRARNGLVPTKPRNLSDLHDPVVGWLDENGWVLDIDRSGRADVRCPWEGEHTSDSGPSASSWFPAGVGGFAQGHYRCLHAHCAARTDGDFLEAVGYGAADFAVVETVANAKGALDQPLPAFVRDRRGAPLATLNNLLMALRRPDVCGLRIGYDDFKAAIMAGADTWAPMDDHLYVDIRSRLEAKGFLPIGRELVRDAVHKVAMEQRFDSAQQWAETLRWDGVERIDTFWPTYFNVDDTPYSRAVGAYAWTALAGRCVEPGVKADMVPVLIGLQGTGKTSSIEALCPIAEAFVEVNLEKKDDDIARSLRGKLVGEIAELRGLQSRDAESIKAWVSRRTEEWVPKYREFATRFERRLLLIGTGNREFLDDDTGERRWLPMTVGDVDVAAVRAVRDQLWAEGLVRFRQGGVEWQDAQRLAPVEHSKFKVGDDPWTEAIADWLARDSMDGMQGTPRGHLPVSTRDVLVSAIGLSLSKITRRDELRVGKVFRMLRFEKRDMRIGGVVAKRWVRAEGAINRGFVEHAKNSTFEDLA